MYYFMKNVILGLCVMSVIVFFLSSAAFSAPQIINYQGQLNDAAGKPVNGQKTMIFRIYAAIDATLTQALWNSGNVNIQVFNGLFSVNLGESPQPPFPVDLFSGDNRFLGITVDDSELLDRKKLTSVPYALNAGSANVAPAIPKGVIVMWSGSVAQIPSGWALCNGQNGTPDLRDRFIVGVGNTYAIGNSGGSISKNLSHTHAGASHTHTIGTDGSHTHQISDIFSDSYCPKWGGRKYTLGETVADNTHPTDLSGSHSHGGPTGAQGTDNTGSGGSSSQDIMPPYYALCFIMKL